MTGSAQPSVASPASAACDGGIDRAPGPSAIRSRTWNSRRKRLVCSTAERRTVSGLAPWRRTGKTLGFPACRPARRRGLHRNGCPSRRRGREPCSKPGSVRGRPARRYGHPPGRRCRARRPRPSRTRRCAPRRAPRVPSARTRPRCRGRTGWHGRGRRTPRDAVAEMLDLLPSETGEVDPDVPVVGGQHLTPDVVTQVDSFGPGIGDVGEDQGDQPALSGDRSPRPDEEVLHLVQDGLGVADEGEMVDPLQLNEPGIGDLGRDLASMAHRDQTVVTTLEHQGGHRHGGEDVDQVVGVERRQQGQNGAAADRLSRVLGQPLGERLVAHHARGPHLHRPVAGHPPTAAHGFDEGGARAVAHTRPILGVRSVVGERSVEDDACRAGPRAHSHDGRTGSVV